MDGNHQLLKQHSSELQLAITSVIEQFTRNLEKNLTHKVNTPQIPEDAARSFTLDREALVQQVDRLSRHNELLTEELRRFKDRITHQYVPTTKDSVSPATSPATNEAGSHSSTVPRQCYDGLVERYNTLLHEVLALRHTNSALKEKNNRLKGSTKEWYEWANRRKNAKKHSASASNREKGETSHESGKRIMTPPPAPLDKLITPFHKSVAYFQEVPTPLKTIPEVNPGEMSRVGGIVDHEDEDEAAYLMSQDGLNAQNPVRNLAAEGYRQLAPADRPIDKDVSAAAMGPPASSQATVNDEPTPTHLSQTHSEEDDIPVFVSERNLKRKFDQTGPDSKKKPAFVKIKDEPSDSPPHVSIPPALHRICTFDLDEPNQVIDTPRKRTRVENLQASFNLNHPSRNHLKRPTTLPPDINPGMPLSEDIYDSTKHVHQSVEQTEIKLESRVEQGPYDERDSTVLKPLDQNTLPQLHAKGQGQKNETRSRRRIRGFVSEDVESATQNSRIDPNDSEVGQPTSPSIKEEPDRRLKDLLAFEAPAKKPLDIIRTPVTARKVYGLQQPTPPTSDPNNTTQNPSKASSSRPVFNPQTPIETKQGISGSTSRLGKSTLRSKPLSRLSIADFKPNPKFNQGVDHAFVETVRNRDARRCLPGCTRPECCGSAFRALVEAGGGPSFPRGLFDDSQDDDDDEKFLRWYLGASYTSERKRTMKPGERKELILSAKTQMMADTHGKHRQAYERQATPPGFWRTDMPTTQEIEKDRQEARQKQKQIIEERYREAMRGGRWVFRDE